MTTDPALAQREILWNLSSPANVVLMYALFGLSLFVFCYGIWRRYCLWMAGPSAPERLGDFGSRLRLLWLDVVAQRKTNRHKKARVYHSLILWGFVILLFTTTMVLIDHDFGIPIYRGRFYLAVTLLSDLFGFGLLVGVLHVLQVRYLERPDRLHNNYTDAVMLIFLGLMVVQGFLLEGLRIRATDDPWALFSPVGLLVSQFFWGLSENGLRVLHFGTWWFHSVTVFAFIALIPYTKFFHIFSSSANLYFREVRRPKGALPHPGDLEALMEHAIESDADFSLGIGSLEDVDWKDRLDFDACTACGRCQDVCPAYNSGKILSPKWLILDSRAHMHRIHVQEEREGRSPLQRMDAELLDAFTLSAQPYLPEGPAFERAENPLVQEKAVRAIGVDKTHRIAGEVLDPDVFWACTTCRACVEVCPVGIEHVDYIVENRRNMVLMQGEMPTEAQQSIRAIETRGNPFGPAESRADWMQGLDVKVMEENDSVDVLYWVGCVSAFDRRKQAIARAMVQILNASGVSWGTLGNRECCTGDPARRLGDENVFQVSAKQNLATLQSVSFERIVANCPHCFNSLKNEYPQLGEIAQARSIEILHHSHFIQQLLDSGSLPVSKQSIESVSFHDPCYLGRYNDTYQEPRETLVQIGASDIREMKDSRERGMCCGAGGGHYWFDMKSSERVNTQRVSQALETGASLLATACPFCLQMLEDGTKLNEAEDRMQVMDIAELVAERLLAQQH